MTNEMWGVKVLTREHSSDERPHSLTIAKSQTIYCTMKKFVRSESCFNGRNFESDRTCPNIHHFHYYA